MKKQLPKNVKNPQGFTLVELLVVISIIAILALIGLAIFSGLQARARNAKRASDIKAIGNAVEVNKVGGSSFYLTNIQPTWISGGIFPSDPRGGAQEYCYYYRTTVGPITPLAPAVVWVAPAACPPIAQAVGSNGVYGITAANANAASNIAAATNVAAFMVCALLEAEGVGGTQSAICVNSQQ